MKSSKPSFHTGSPGRTLPALHGHSMAAALVLCCLASSFAGAATFEEQRKVVAASTATQTEAAISSLLKAALEEGKPAQAITLVQKWLSHNQPKDSALLFSAGRAGELSGDWKSAVALYQQYLKNADFKDPAADEALYAIYVLLIERLNDTHSAYAFSRSEGGRLLTCPRARQFDQWFLDEAIKRSDATAVAERLNACITAGYSADLLNARYSHYFVWLLSAVDGYCDHGLPVTQELYDAVKDLCESITHNEEMKLRLDWAVSVKAYNVARIGDKSKAKVGVRAGGKNNKNAADKTAGKKQPGDKSADAKAAAAQAVEEKKLELGAEAAPPITEATALLEKFPRHALWVMTGWAGGGNGPHYRNDPKMYWPHEAEAKIAPILTALSKLPASEASEILNAAAHGGYVKAPGVLELKSVQEFLKANPDFLNGRQGVFNLDKEWNKLTPEEAQKLAPQMAQVTHPQASLVRAIASGGKDFDKALAALLGEEAWRLSPGELNSMYADQLWHYCGRPSGSQKRDEGITKSKALAASFAGGDAKKEDPSDLRLATFRKLWADYTSEKPKIPAVRSRLVTVLKFTPEILPELLKDPAPEALSIAREAISSGFENAKGSIERDDRIRGLSISTYNPWILRLANINGGIDQFKRSKKDLYLPHPLETVLRATVEERLAKGKIEPWLILAWINAQFPENNADQIKLMQALFKSPAWQSAPFEVQYAAREWFKKEAMTSEQSAWIDAGDPKVVCKDMLLLTKASDAASVSNAVRTAIEGVKKSPVRMELQGMDQLGTVSSSVLGDPKVFEQVLEVADGLRDPCRSSEFGKLFFPLVKEKRDPVMLHRVANFLWSHTFYSHRYAPFLAVKALIESVVDDHPSAAIALARAGLHYFSKVSGEFATNQAYVPALKGLVAKSSMKLGLMDIPVAASHPAYPIYKSQADWRSGNEDNAWALCGAHWNQMLTVHRELSMEYLMWALQRSIFSRDESRQAELVKVLLAWAKEPNTLLSPSHRIELEIAYGDIAIQRGMLKQAHEIFLRAANNKAYEGLLTQHEATLRQVRVERMAKDFDAALQSLSELEMKRVPEMWAPTRYARAEVYYDMEEFDNAAEDIESILAREPGHAEAKIMQGKLQLKRQKLMEATEVELGAMSSQQSLVPGERLKVTLTDPTLAVSGTGTEIEVVVWATSGDKESFFLRQFGDQKTKFRGEVATALGEPKPDDRILQVIGDDQIFYAYSERFRKKMNNLDEKRGGPIAVASDALLIASARKLLSEAEQRVADMEAEMADLKGGATSAGRIAAIQARKAADSLLESEMGDEANSHKEMEILQKRLSVERAKPGKPIYVRVIDPDRSRTAAVDELAVSVESSSGDSIARVVLKETGTHTGWFEGTVQTAGAQAMAFAENSEPGRNPNMVISPTPDYPAWRPVAAKGKSPEFKVDLNDNLPLGELTILAKEPGNKLKKFFLQTGMAHTGMTTVAVHPQNLIAVAKPWHPSVTIMNDTDTHHVRNDRSVYDIRELETHLDRGWISEAFSQGVAENVASFSEALSKAIPAKVDWKRQNRNNTSHVVYRFCGYFYEPASVLRRFRVELGKYDIPAGTHPSVNHPAQFMLAVDGNPITRKENIANLEGEIELRPGLHRFELWATGWNTSIGFGRSVKLLANLNNPQNLTDCPDRFFDPSTFPKDLLTHRNAPAAITANADGTEFKVKFAPGSRTRLLNFVFLEQESPAPALNKISLTDSSGKKILPVAQDFATLNKNDHLEMLTGDKVSVRYVDDRYVTKSKESQQRSLNVAFTSATMRFDFFEMVKNRNGEETPYYEELYRFEHGNPVLLTIEDADMDASPKPDTVSVILESKTGGKRTFAATETGDSTGIFRLRITPVTGTTTKDNEIQTGEGDTLTATYRDAENMEPGIPVDRQTEVRHALFTSPQLILSHSTVTPIDPANRPYPQVLNEGFMPVNQETAQSKTSPNVRRSLEAGKGIVQPRWSVANELLPASSPPAKGFEAVLGQNMYIEIDAPHLALRASSQIEVYVQTEAGRKRAKESAPQVTTTEPKTAAPAPVFDVRVPGTVQLNALYATSAELRPLGFNQTPEISIYSAVKPVQNERFVCNVPLVTGVLPEHGVLSREEIAERRKEDKLFSAPYGLVVQPGDRIHIGFRYKDKEGAERWITASTKAVSHPVLDLMEDDYRTAKTKAHVGETIYLRVVDLGADVSDRSDTVRVLVESKNGAKYPIELHEVDTHSGVFKGTCTLSYAKAGNNPGAGAVTNDVKTEGFPVIYNDVVRARYTDANGQRTDILQVDICKGADGTIQPFSKKYDDPEIAMRTQFTLAESILEVAKHNREQGNNEAAAQEYERAKQLLTSVMEQFRDPETRAHAEYQLGAMLLEEADATQDRTVREERYRAALSRFMTVTGSYPDAAHASKAQFRIATVYERLNEAEIAAQEYVKLAYKYPNSEFLAISMARLGTHFLRKAGDYEKQAKALLEKTEDKDAQFEGAAVKKLAILEYRKSATIFVRLQSSFPGHELAGKGGMSGGQAYMRAGDHRLAVNIFLKVISNESYDGPEVRAQSMYWAGMCYETLNEPMAAYSMYKRLTFDFPETKWAAYARAQLSQDKLVNLENDLEIKRLKEGR